MKKVLPLGIAVPVLALMGLGLRLWQLASAWEAEGGLTVPWAPASMALVCALALAAGVTLALAKVTTAARTGYLQNFHHDSKVFLGVFILSGALVLKGGVDGIVKVFSDKAAGLGLSWLGLLLAAGFIAGGVSMALIGVQGRRTEAAAGMGFLPLVIPGYCGCLWLVSIYQGHTANPELFEYVLLLLGVAAAILALYTMAGFSFEKKAKPVRCAWFSSMAVILLVTDLADWRDGMTASVELGLAVFLYAQLLLLLWRGVFPARLKEEAPEEAKEVPPAEAAEEMPEKETAEMPAADTERAGAEAPAPGPDQNTEEIGEDSHE